MNGPRASVLPLMDGLNVSRETFDRLETYLALLEKWNAKINLVSKTTINDAWNRHFVDSAQLARIPTTAKGLWLDLGSGAGFPGLVLSIIFSETRPDMTVRLVESDIRKCVFLREVVNATRIQAEIINTRIESLEPQNADIISARALTSLDNLLSFSDKHFSKNGKGLFLKGENYASELAEARTKWRFDCETIPSATNLNAIVLCISHLSSAGKEEAC